MKPKPSAVAFATILLAIILMAFGTPTLRGQTTIKLGTVAGPDSRATSVYIPWLTNMTHVLETGVGRFGSITNDPTAYGGEISAITVDHLITSPSNYWLREFNPTNSVFTSQHGMGAYHTVAIKSSELFSLSQVTWRLESFPTNNGLGWSGDFTNNTYGYDTVGIRTSDSARFAYGEPSTNLVDRLFWTGVKATYDVTNSAQIANVDQYVRFGVQNFGFRMNITIKRPDGSILAHVSKTIGLTPMAVVPPTFSATVNGTNLVITAIGGNGQSFFIQQIGNLTGTNSANWTTISTLFAVPGGNVELRFPLSTTINRFFRAQSPSP